MILLFVLSTVLQLVHLHNPSEHETSVQTSVEVLTGHLNVFTRDTVRLKCVVPSTPYNSTWMYKWYNGPEQLFQFEQQLVLWKIKTKNSGKYYCQGFRDTNVRDIPTLQSLPVEINVDGGWAILDAPSKGVVGYPMNMTCRVRNNPPTDEVILYRDGVEVSSQNHPTFVLNNVTLENLGQYTCRASWVVQRRTYSVISTQVSVQVVEPLTKPTLIIVDDAELRSLTRLKLVCQLEYNVPAPAPPVLYYFYKDGQRLGTPLSENFTLIIMAKGKFTCNAKVPQLGLSQWSEPAVF